jgi:hypothetical protein
MADEVQIKFGADIGGALSAVNALKQAVTAATAPVSKLKTAFIEAGAAAQAAFRVDMRGMVAERAISLRQALGFDIEYAAQRSELERGNLERVLSSDAASFTEKSLAYAQLAELSDRYSAQLAQDQARLAAAARMEADRFAQPYRQAFDGIGAGWRSVVIGLVEGTLNFQAAALRVAQSVERGFIGMAQTTLSRAASGPLTSLLGLTAPAAGEGVGDVLGGWIGGLLAFSKGGIVPSAAGGWALPSFAGATPALLHSREMVLPAPLSEGLQGMIAQGGGGDTHLHFHGPSDGPAVERWFAGLMARNPAVVRNMLRSNALTPRTI